jgi:very-short-patch-repair endonuclease
MRGCADEGDSAMRTRDLATTGRAERLRAAATDAERKLGYKLRDRRLGGAKFVRQAPVAKYFADFLCRKAKLVVEIDGSQHAENRYDEERDGLLLSEGCSVLRFWNGEVMTSIDGVCETVLAALEDRLEPFDRFKKPISRVGAAPHPALRATFSPQGGEKGLSSPQASP